MLLVQVMIVCALQYFALSWGARATRGKGRKLRRKFSRIGDDSEGNLFNATTLALEVQQRWKHEEEEIRDFAKRRRKRRKKRSQISQGYSCNLRNDRHCRCHDNICCSTNPGYQGAYICDECIERRSLQCDFCDRRGRNCMTFQPNSSQFTDICTLPVKVGACRGSLKKWYFDVESQRCETFLYGGCQGNANRFESKAQCQRECQNEGNFAAKYSFNSIIDGCLQLGGALLEEYRIDGTKRSSRSPTNKRQVINEFKDLTCHI